MSEKTAVGYARELVASLWHSFPEDAEQPIAEAIAAAEERGRLSGVEEAKVRVAELETLVGRCEEALLVPDESKERRLLADLKADRNKPRLAPRDSAPVCDAVVSSNGLLEWRCAKRKDHEGPHSGGARALLPRDSGKEG